MGTEEFEQPDGRRRATPLKVALVILAVLAVVAILFTVVFPRVERYFENPTLGGQQGAPVTWVA